MLAIEDYQRQYKNLKDFCKVFKDINELMNWYKYNGVIWPHDDGKEYNERCMNWVDDILVNKIGNCFDHAIFVYCFCKENDIPCKVYRLSVFAESVFLENNDRYKNYDHIVSASKFLGKWYVFDYVEDPYSNLFGPFSNLHDLMEDYKYRYANGMISFIKSNTDPYFYRSISEPYITELSDKDLNYIISLYNDHILTQKEISQNCQSYRLPLDEKIIHRVRLESIIYKINYHIKNFVRSQFYL